MKLSQRHQVTLAAVFTVPVLASIAWRDIEALFVACGGEISEGEGSRVRVARNGVRANFIGPSAEGNRQGSGEIRVPLSDGSGITP